ncbi:putative hybrid NRPS/PKS enzyme [Aspergillus bertholletiae]|uniref:Putative hybrid NRPS/PKS enzyme n=1 Tax=Aspergillus bertholletiae TaxID=1226010 RepID=A0A5N7AVD9_9EURO|nr:putative hybrid NRPS/PKS enzyme [Aspergillus bertholletiae]
MAPNTHGTEHEPIAIIGSGCRFPGEASSPSRLWDLLKEPRDVQSRIPTERFNASGFYHPDNRHHGTSNVQHAYLLTEDHRQFDASFFGIKPVEANAIDPQQRLLLETVYESLEAAGIPIEQLQGTPTAVFVGLMCGDYADLLGRDTSDFPTYFATGTARSIISNRISYFFDWHGPSMTIDTACSSSLVAVHQAVQVLRSGESQVAIAAGANLLLGPEQYIAESKLQMLSPDGRSYMWDARANGYARGEGIASVVLKTLSAAIADGDHIECIIRETGINQDGKTKGITMPSSSAQAALIRDTYRKAGLNLADARDRPQYFEAHGTGTPAGDPTEAGAIYSAFFPVDMPKTPGSDPLYVGSIKTVVGHTEGTAGLAGLLKASLALQHATIPPNRLFERVSSTVKPFYGDLQIATAAKKWPIADPNGPRRASVNSFGFGGANAHCILESYDAQFPAKLARSTTVHDQVFTPCTFSAASERSLTAMVESYSAFLREQPSINLRALSHTLSSRRSALPVRISFAATGVDDLRGKLDLFVEGNGGKAVTAVPQNSEPLRVLGVFTGQGAQWAQMATGLMQSSAVIKIVERLERSLAELPAADRPNWSLRKELLADKGASRINEASFSQPLCTAVQIILVDLLRAAGIEFDVVVGHSSGEISAAYAAGYVSATDAIRIAYLRGLHLHLAHGKRDQAGAMLAVGTSYDDAQEFCKLRKFRGKIRVAASNSPTSVTLSGDADAIINAKAVFEEEKRFARLLKVDKAYHSHHMLACSEAYRNSLRQCGITVRSSADNKCTWISSVYQQDIREVSVSLRDEYWVQNLVSPVLFSQALEYALGELRCDVALEVGPHPALKGPATQVIQEATGDTIPYTGVLSRGKPDAEAFANGLGYVWSCTGKRAVDFTALDRLMNADADPPRLLKGCPSYPWEHDRVYWHESRISKAFRERPYPPHVLLGTRSPNFSNVQIRWDNYLIPRELPWISGHQIQGQMVFPAAGYMSTAFEAARQVAGDEAMKLIELKDFIIGQPLVFDSESSSVEITVSLTDIHREGSVLTANFHYFSTASKEHGPMLLNANGALQITFGDPKVDILPPTEGDPYAMIDVDTDQFYDCFAAYGYGYTGPFKALSAMERKIGLATGQISVPESNTTEGLIMHPATLDGAIQSILLAYCYPGDGRLQSIQLPTQVSRLVINPDLCLANSAAGQEVKFISTIGHDDGARVDGDVDVYPMDGQCAMLQLEGLHTKPMVPATESMDFNLFSETVWDTASPDALASDAADEDFEFGFVLERVAYFYLNHIQRATTASDRNNCEWYFKHLLAYVDTMLGRVARNDQPFTRPEWANDSREAILSIIQSYPESIDLRIMHAVGENIVAAIRGETTILEHMLYDNMLNDFYVKGLGMTEYLKGLTSTVKQIGHRYPTMNVLEIGAGTGGATKSILKELDTAFASYTYTDISSGFFEQAAQEFSAYQPKIAFRTLDIEKDVVDQGFPEESFDLIVASLVLHATGKLEETMKNARRLLKPGGYLIMLELTDNDPLRFGFIFGSLPGWWLGVKDGRELSPCIESPKWSDLLQSNGFSGLDLIKPNKSDQPLPLCVMLSQAVDDRVHFLRAPLSSPNDNVNVRELTIIGGSTAKTADCVSTLTRDLRPYCGDIRNIRSLPDLRGANLSVGGCIIYLADYEDPLFNPLSESKLKGLQKLFEKSKVILWVTRGLKACVPYAKMAVGFVRCVLQEMRHVRVQFLDIDPGEDLDMQHTAETFLRFVASDTWAEQGQLKSLLWSLEPEVAYAKSKEFIPRVRLSKTLNNRYNSAKRAIAMDVSPASQSITLMTSGNAPVFRFNSSLVSTGPVNVNTNQPVILVSHSMVQAVAVGSLGYLFLVLGKVEPTGDPVIALSTSLSSRVSVHPSWVRPNPFPTKQAVEYLVALFYALLADSMLEGLSGGDTLVVLEPSEKLTGILEPSALRRGIQLRYMTSAPSATKKTSWTTLHPQASRREVAASLPGKVSRVLSWGHDIWNVTIREQLGTGTPIETLESLTSDHAYLNKPHLAIQVSDTLDVCRTQILSSHPMVNFDDVFVVPLHLIQGSNHRDLAVIDWSASASVPVTLEPVDARPLFKPDKTYWLVGLTGGLGLSLCKWMVARGARYIVISSRNPKVDPRWISDLAAVGATLKVCSSDVTRRESLVSVYHDIQASLPPVAGVCQGAMVLQDTLFVDLNMERMEKVLRPKVLGAQYLDEIFSDQPLDFFVFLSSMASVTGNPGQAAYAAANMFLAGLAAQRRQRGVAASTVHIGAIIGNGYVTRELNFAQQMALQKVGNTWMSEQDFYQIFAEAVVASPPRPGPNVEYYTGLRVFYADEEEKPQFADNPVFSHLIMYRKATTSADSGATAAASVRAQLSRATTAEEVYDIMKVSLVSKLQSALQASPDLDIIAQNADTLGIDSLVAVDLRSWFLKELNVDMPVLKIISGASMGELLDRAQEILPPELVPTLGAEPSAVNPAPATIESQKPDLKTTLQPPVLIDIPEKEEAPSNVIEQVEGDDWGVGASDANPAEALIQSISTVNSSPESVSEPNDDPSNSSESSFEMVSPPVEVDSMAERSLPMSFSQSRFWFLRFYLEDPTAFNVTTAIHLDGRIQVDKLANAVEVVGNRHEALRTRFFTDENNQPMQAIRKSGRLRLETKQISARQDVSQEYTRLKNHVYDLENGEVARIMLLSQSPQSHFILLGYHHINMDGVSFEIFFADLQKAYYSSLEIQSPVLQYSNFASRQRQEYADGKWANELAFWRQELSTIPAPQPLLPLSTATSRRPLTRYGSYLASHRVPSALSAQISSTCKKLRIQPFHFYLTVYRVMIARFTNVDDLCIGVADAGRNDSDTQQSLGCYLNLLPVRFATQLTSTFSEAVKETKTRAQQAFAHSRVPFDVLLTELQVPRSANANPLFQVLLNYRQGVSEARSFCGCDCEWTDFDGGQTPYDLSLDVIDNAGGDALLRLFVQSSLYPSQAAEHLLKVLVHLLDAFSQNPATRLSRPALHAESDTTNAVTLARGEYRPSAWQGTLIHRIDAMVEQHGPALAVKDGLGHRLSYQQMTARVNHIAARLAMCHGFGEGSNVGVFQSPAVDWICSLLAILRLGAAYVPLDPKVATARLAAIVQDCQPAVILTDTANEATLRNILPPSTEMVNISDLPVTTTTTTVPNVSQPNRPAAILYTSGTTGTPKGIVMHHTALRDHVETVTNAWTSPRDGALTMLQQSSFSFDMSLVQIFWPLASGGRVYVVPQAHRGDPVAISRTLKTEDISWTAATPSEYLGWLEFGNVEMIRTSPWKLCVSGGEAFPDRLANALLALKKPDLRVMNCYGPTETTFFSHFRELTPADLQNDGARSLGLAPWANTATYIVDANLNPQPVGVLGEIAIGGMGVAAGYSNREDLTAQRFLPDRFSQTDFTRHGWTRMHLTGDRGRLLADGSLELQGRVVGDTQVKLRGLRIDLQDIEAVIVRSSQGRILHAVVSVRQLPPPSGEDMLVAHVELAAQQPDAGAFCQQLAAKLPLPQYMRPSLIIALDQLPRMASGKVDRLAVNALSLPAGQQVTGAQSSSAIDETESQLRGLWEEVLTAPVMGCFTVNAQSDFFHIGGTSLLLVRLQALIKERFTVELPLSQLFDSSTLGGMAYTIYSQKYGAQAVALPEIVSSSSVDDTTPEDSRPGPQTLLPAIDWANELALPSSLNPYTVLGAHEPRIVLLTGASGFLGRALLERLVSAPSIKRVYCIAMRANARRDATVFASPKVQVYAGDQTLPALGLNPGVAERIFSEADTIIHNGADVSFMKTYGSLRTVNVESTKQLAHFAATHGLQFHFISTGSVTYLSGQESYGARSVRDFLPPVDGSNGYIATKWASEVFLEGMNATFGLPVVIHRPSSVTGAGAPSTDVMGALLRFSTMMRAIPRADSIRGWFDFVSVGTAAETIVETVLAGIASVGVRYVFESGETQVESTTMKEALERQTGETFDMLEMSEWVKRALVLGMDSMVAAFLEGPAATQGLLMTRLVSDNSIEACA